MYTFTEPLKKSEVYKKLNEGSPERRRSFYMNESNLDKELNHWAEYKIEGKKISRRCYHTAAFYNSSLYVYGGYEINQGVLQDFYKVDLTSDQSNSTGYHWEEIVANSELKPGPLCRHSVIVNGNKMYLFGGQINSTENTNQFIAYDFEKNSWEKIVPVTEGEIPPMDSHTVYLWEKEPEKKTMILFGGFIGGQTGDYSNAVYEYDFETNKWETLFENKIVEAAEISKSSIPQGRMAHASAINNNQLYIFGGFDGNTRLNDIWNFDLVNKKWLAINAEGAIPEPRNGHSLVSYKNSLILFGGIHDVTHEKNDIVIFNVDKNSWEVLEKETKWRFEDEHSKDRKKSLKPDQAVTVQAKPSKFGPEKVGNKLTVPNDSNFADSVSVTSDNIDEMSVSVSKYSLQKNFHIATKPHKYNKVRLETYNTKHTGLVSPQSSKNFTFTANSPTNAEHKSSLQERKEKDMLMKKAALLKEFEISEQEGERLRAPTPTTEAMRKSLNGLGLTIDNHSDFHSQKTALDQTKMNLMKFHEVNNNSIKLGAKPCARDGHSACVEGNKLYIFAGDRHRMSFNDLFMLNLDYIHL